MKHYCVMEVMQGAAVTHRPSPAHLHTFQVNVWLHRPADGEFTAFNDSAVLSSKIAIDAVVGRNEHSQRAAVCTLVVWRKSNPLIADNDL